MTPESPQNDLEKQFLSTVALLGAVVFLSQFAFSSGIRKQILNRDRGKDVWTGETEGLEAAHITHDRNDPLYNDPSNGRMLTTRNHYIDHLNRAGRNGLTISGNNAALRLIWQRMNFIQKLGLPPPPEEQTW